MADNTYFENPYDDNVDDTYSVNAPYLNSLIRHYVRQIIENTQPHPEHEQTDPKANMFLGNTGIAYMFLKLQQSPHNFTDLQPNSYACDYILDAKFNTRAMSMSNNEERCALLKGTAGMFCVSAVIASEIPNDLMKNRDLACFRSGFELSAQLDFDKKATGRKGYEQIIARDDMLVGRAGYLSGIYFINKHIEPKEFTNMEIIRLCQSVIKSGRNAAQKKGSKFPLLFPLHGCDHLGALHGMSSILLALLNSPLFYRNSQTDNFININVSSKGRYQYIKDSIDRLLELQDQHGNFLSALEDYEIPPPSVRLTPIIRWCHGSPGIIYLFMRAAVVFREEKYLDAARKIADVIWERGLLKSGPGLCHGIAGNGYALLVLYRLTKEKRYLRRAYKFAQFLTTPEFMSLPDSEDYKYSLFEGLSGAVCFLVDLLEPLSASFPFMDISGNCIEPIDVAVAVGADLSELKIE
ncbi:LanC-like protein 3 like [Pseudolycoriella hygida]|uniref:LanC-like protein 3 like n=1 Tax=Pseudolycoriella hygida TaxID=35572 RepID=A0A9Q0MM81_9DIPT|nr:LanC-like protein 3 like [Pseudolycoriella hygida]KAJ6634464.1 LanC-like protein 3 like [Pseudolycoriella hygida]